MFGQTRVLARRLTLSPPPLLLRRRGHCPHGHLAAGVRRLPVPACLSIYPPSPPGLPHTIKPRSHLITITPTPTLFPVPRVRSDVVALQGTMEPNSALAQMVGIQTVAGSAARTMAFGM